MRRAVWYGQPGAPQWVATIALAEKWHMYPGDLADKRGALKWVARQALIDDLRRQKAKLDEQMAGR